jgi:hypothetical protein
MEHEHGAFKVNLKTFPCHPWARLKKGAKNLRFAAGSTAVRTLQRKKLSAGNLDTSAYLQKN